MSKLQSRCMYCGSTSYGSGCVFSAKHIHIHTDDPTRCIYCGMMAYGSGCIFNPYNHMHVHGMDVGQAIAESVRKTVELTYLTDRLFENIKDSEAYRLKLINESGVLIRAPETPYEQRLVSPLSNFLQNIKKYLVADSASVVNALKLQQNNVHNETIEEYESKLQFEHEVKHIINQLKQLITDNITSMSLESVEGAIESAILNAVTDCNEK